MDDSSVTDFKREYLSFRNEELEGLGEYKTFLMGQLKRTKLTGRFPSRDLILLMFDIAACAMELNALEESKKWKARILFELASGASVDGWQTEELNTNRNVIERMGQQPAGSTTVEQFQQQPRG